MIDFSVSDAEAGGGSFTDNNGGMDYHIDVSESLTQAQPLNVVHVAVEMAPIAKVGFQSIEDHSFVKYKCLCGSGKENFD